MQISEAAGGAPEPGVEPCRFPKLEECAHFHYERVQLPNSLQVALQTSMDQSLHSQHSKLIITGAKIAFLNCFTQYRVTLTYKYSLSNTLIIFFSKWGGRVGMVYGTSYIGRGMLVGAKEFWKFQDAGRAAAPVYFRQEDFSVARLIEGLDQRRGSRGTFILSIQIS